MKCELLVEARKSMLKNTGLNRGLKHALSL